MRSPERQPRANTVLKKIHLLATVPVLAMIACNPNYDTITNTIKLDIPRCEADSKMRNGILTINGQDPQMRTKTFLSVSGNKKVQVDGIIFTGHFASGALNIDQRSQPKDHQVTVSADNKNASFRDSKDNNRKYIVSGRPGGFGTDKTVQAICETPQTKP